ncbi:isocitrate lyase/phosphoenolpyruvate mutase family protein [Paenibacillus puldeungensis]|uniref:Isocitrate lyase/phosphoenolpyruvate mutase family protein n=1 Tax=Paenibacillus puldeungensis TaxID=696536 RepID=A0ABW3RVU1_9BACL
MNEKRRGQAEQLRRLHHGTDVLMLPNAWDAVSAKLFERSGFAAIGTSSAGSLCLDGRVFFWQPY